VAISLQVSAITPGGGGCWSITWATLRDAGRR
jgi:hypothetical protein